MLLSTQNRLEIVFLGLINVFLITPENDGNLQDRFGNKNRQWMNFPVVTLGYHLSALLYLKVPTKIRGKVTFTIFGEARVAPYPAESS